MRKTKITKEIIEACLPTPPVWGSYTVEQFSKLVHRVWLNDSRFYSHTTDPVRTVWGFVKSNGDVMKPRNSQKISTDRVCHVANIPERLSLTTITPKYTTLLSLYD